jgi:hypothetical protein
MENDLAFRDAVADLAVFRRIIEPKAKGTASKQPNKILAAEEKAAKDMVTAQDLLSRVNLTSAQFVDSYNRIKKDMDPKLVPPRQLRGSPDLRDRLVAMSALIWNPVSHAKGRDWALIAISFALEAAYVSSYRPALLVDCAGAHAVRNDLHDLFLSVALRVSVPGSTSRASYWDFADGFKLGEVSSELTVHTLDTLMSCWSAAHDRFVLGEKDPAYKVIRYLENIKLLESSISGSVEALARYYIDGLAEVRLPFSLPPLFSLCVAGRLYSRTKPASTLRQRRPFVPRLVSKKRTRMMTSLTSRSTCPPWPCPSIRGKLMRFRPTTFFMCLLFSSLSLPVAHLSLSQFDYEKLGFAFDPDSKSVSFPVRPS